MPTSSSAKQLIDDACRYPLEMRLAARLLFIGVTELEWQNGREAMLKGVRHHKAWPFHLTVQNYMRDLAQSGIDARLQKLASEL